MTDKAWTSQRINREDGEIEYEVINPYQENRILIEGFGAKLLAEKIAKFMRELNKVS